MRLEIPGVIKGERCRSDSGHRWWSLGRGIFKGSVPQVAGSRVSGSVLGCNMSMIRV